MKRMRKILVLPSVSENVPKYCVGYRHVWASLRPFVRSLCQLDFSCLPALFPVLYPNCGNVALSMRWAKRLARQYILRGVR